jgi:GTP cyclohydrolase IB
MEDLQSLADLRNVPIERVGITKLALPVQIREKDDGFQHVLAEASMFVEVPATIRGTHMSRFVEVLHEWADRPVSSSDIESLLLATRERAGSLSAEAGLTFRYFIRKAAPVSGRVGAVDYQCSFRGRIDELGYRFALRVRVPVTTLCPCSKAISDYGAHNQRTFVEVEIESPAKTIVWIEDVVSLVEEQASCPVFSVLKREDEKWATERAYENPKFVEDVVRDVLLHLAEHPGVEHLSVTSESIESIHNHNAYAAASTRALSRGDLEVRRWSAVPRLATVD